MDKANKNKLVLLACTAAAVAVLVMVGVFGAGGVTHAAVQNQQAMTEQVVAVSKDSSGQIGAAFESMSDSIMGKSADDGKKTTNASSSKKPAKKKTAKKRASE